MGLQWRQPACVPKRLIMQARCIDDEIVHEWYAVQVWTGREHLSANHLRQRGYEVFLPCYRDHRRWSDRVKTIDRALFAGYVFCRLHAEAAGKIVTSPGVIRMVGDGRGPVPIPGSEIDAIQRIVQTRLAAEPWQLLDVGQRVRIEAGPLRGTEGVVLMVKNRHRLVVSITLLQRAVAVDVDPEWISIPPAAWLGCHAGSPAG
jgi:transcription antitermination factor NusG